MSRRKGDLSKDGSPFFMDIVITEIIDSTYEIILLLLLLPLLNAPYGRAKIVLPARVKRRL